MDNDGIEESIAFDVGSMCARARLDWSRCLAQTGVWLTRGQSLSGVLGSGSVNGLVHQGILGLQYARGTASARRTCSAQSQPNLELLFDVTMRFYTLF